MQKLDFIKVECLKIRFTYAKTNYLDGEKHSLRHKGFELFSTEPKYPNGVFATFFENSKDKDPHKFPVVISSPRYNPNFYSLNSKSYIFAFDWFEIELTQGMAILTGFRLKRSHKYIMKRYKIICTDDSSKPHELWTTLIEVNKIQDFDIYEFQNPSHPAKFVRIIPSDNENDQLGFVHFELFGKYF